LGNDYESKSLPNELLSLYRRRSKLTQLELSNLIRLKSDRMVRNWESGISLPVAKRLENLIQVYLMQEAFTPGNEGVEIRQLWNCVKRMYEGANERFSIYPIFDEHWLSTLLNEQVVFDIPIPSNEPISNKLRLGLVEQAHTEFSKKVSSQLHTLYLIPQIEQVTGNISINLPISSNRFIGREKEVVMLCQILDQPTLPVVTITGPIGVGKTRLAKEVVKKSQDNFKDGILKVDLASLTDELHLLQTLAKELGVSKEKNQPILSTLADYLHNKLTLVVLDNCDHLLNACANTIERLLPTCQNLKFLVTTREAMNLASETILIANPLSLPKEGEPLSQKRANQAEAITLFVEMASLVQTGFNLTEHNYKVVTHICRFLDGLPLAVELAATLTRALTVEQIAEQLEKSDGSCFQLLTYGRRNTLPHLKTLKDAIDCSYALLSPKEKLLLGQLAVFPESFTLGEVEMKCLGEDGEGNIKDCEVVGILINLVNKSMVLAEKYNSSMQYRLLNIIRQYGLEKLKLSPKLKIGCNNSEV
jgi:predicted ATPase/transcriptional regulator with XRE-family HTH domain